MHKSVHGTFPRRFRSDVIFLKKNQVARDFTQKNLFQHDGVSIEESSFIRIYIAVNLFFVYPSPISCVCRACMTYDEYIVL